MMLRLLVTLLSIQSCLGETSVGGRSAFNLRVSLAEKLSVLSTPTVVLARAVGTTTF